MSSHPTQSIVLASGSPTRKRLLRDAGIPFVAESPVVDEEQLRDVSAREGRAAEEVALALAEAKARAVAVGYPGQLVFGCDQILEIEGAWLGKPNGPGEVKDQLRRLSGRTHLLWSGVTVVRDEVVVWQVGDHARLSMRHLGDSFIDWYIDRTGENACSSVGGYQVEALGAHLFERIDGDWFTVLGLPLLPVLGFLRSEGVVPE